MRTGILATVLAACAAPWAAAVDCKTTSGTDLASCDRWIACKASKGLQCDNLGTLGTKL
jgi:hypothetical protein